VPDDPTLDVGDSFHARGLDQAQLDRQEPPAVQQGRRRAAAARDAQASNNQVWLRKPNGSMSSRKR